MRHFKLLLDTAEASDGEESFYWTRDADSTFLGSLGSSLGSVGAVPSLNIDLVRIAVGVYAADRSVPRKYGGSDWNQREISLTLPLLNVDHWTSRERELASMLDFLSGDSWTLKFVESTPPDEDVALTTVDAARVVLFSGGADSAIGALKSKTELSEKGHHVLVSHYSANHIAPIQKALEAHLAAVSPRRSQSHEVFHLARRAVRLDGSEFESEPSSRSRSFLFLALGLATAAVHGVDLWIPENGFASINPPLGPGRRGSLSTRTTHPAFLKAFNSLLSGSGINSRIRNPFASWTKGEMVAWAIQVLGKERASVYLSTSNSCSSTGQRSFGVPLRVHCGVCFGCVLRRSSFAAADLADKTEYADSRSNAGLANWLERISVVPAVREFVSTGVRPRDLMALSLPHDYKLADALDLTSRGIAELKEYVR
ncbi:7-cyano-7-deazaguanine synthase [Microbacterium oxydans]|uniref:7-cyano-7-deazaguanine synthase n=1 Tax=Microbacterium oxydans TaxID=82380 RepID=UPI000F8F8AD9|nr:7-cyano-7-deazaguanine synthase [Microbacterium oxydans]AZS46058.1 7-cyano-7-deazaguanine synthase [Microbacterium oxydans]